MMIISSIKLMRAFSDSARRKDKRLGFVPTMGALHEGHASLIRQARKENDLVVVSVFVNPAQFGPNEDFKKYPRDLKFDAALCRKEKADVVFYPGVSEIYPQGFKTFVNVDGMSDVLCGRSRPGHFRGVATVVNKLFNIVNPDIAYFGQKDAQQVAVIRKMVKDLNMPVAIKVMPTLRESDGLAMSSRNVYLSQGQRQDALVLNQALKKAVQMIGSGEKDIQKIISVMRKMISSKKGAKIDYICAVDKQDLSPVRKIQDKVLIALAVWFGKTRLIDNIIC